MTLFHFFFSRTYIKINIIFILIYYIVHVNFYKKLFQWTADHITYTNVRNLLFRMTLILKRVPGFAIKLSDGDMKYNESSENVYYIFIQDRKKPL